MSEEDGCLCASEINLDLPVHAVGGIVKISVSCLYRRGKGDIGGTA